MDDRDIANSNNIESEKEQENAEKIIPEPGLDSNETKEPEEKNEDDSEEVIDVEDEVESSVPPETTGKITPREIEEEMKQSYLDYSMSVIVGRALPDVRDGLKPVHRRILYAMHDLGMLHNRPFKKCARIVGEVLGKYHPHGDSAVYDSLVRMVQDFSLRYPLINGQGNFGSVDGDNAAAMRYTEARMHKIAEELLKDIDKETVDFVDNFDGTLKEPSVLPTRLPQLLINGSSGIAVGMATNIPPHNITEICNAMIAFIDNPQIELAELMTYVKGPDFPTSGIIHGTAGIRQAYATGRGKVIVRARMQVEEQKNHERLIVNEIPYMVNKAMLLEQTAELVKDKKIVGISDLRDESDRDGMRIVIELKSGANSQVVQNLLFKHTRMQTTFGMNMLALVDNEPKTLNIKQLISYFVAHRKDVITKRTAFDLRKAGDRAHILEGLIIALNNIDNVVTKIRASKDAAYATEMLIADYSLSEKQAKAILDMKLQKLASLEQKKIRAEHNSVLELIKELKEILADESKIFGIIKDETKEAINSYGDSRRTQILENSDELDLEIEDLIKPEEVVVTLTHRGYVKRLPVDTYRQQRRGGRGVMAAGTHDEDFVEDIFVANTHDYILFFSNKGKVRWLKVYSLPSASRIAMGTALANLLELDKDERINAYIPVKNLASAKGHLFLATKKGTVKKSSLANFARPRKGGIIAINLADEDELIGVKRTDGSQEIIIATKYGKAARFMEKDVREMGRTAAGVRGIKLKEDDSVVSLVVADDSLSLITITENGYGKQTPVSDYRLIGRGGSGVINIKCNERNGNVVTVHGVTKTDGMMLITQKGIGIRICVKDVSTIGRNTQGVRVMRLESGDSIVAAAKIALNEDNGNGNNQPDIQKTDLDPNPEDNPINQEDNPDNDSDNIEESIDSEAQEPRKNLPET